MLKCQGGIVMLEESRVNYRQIHGLSEIFKEKYSELEYIINSEFDQVTIADSDGRISRVYRDCKKIFGISEEQMVGKSGKELENEGVLSKSITDSVLKEKKRISFTQDTAGGKRLTVTGIPIFNNNGDINKIINISRDITENEILMGKLKEAKEILSWFQSEMSRKQAIKSNNAISNSIQMIKVNEVIEQVADSPANILLLGESGVGKSYLAKIIHNLSERRDEPFIQVSCGAIPETLFESELFGYESGAFTGADSRGKIGLLQLAKNGTFFLDEVGEIPMEIQSKLLNVLQEREFYKVGGLDKMKLKARIISATNKDLKQLIREGKFREDLFYRLNVVPIKIPPLRDRREDIPIFIKKSLDRFNKKYSSNKILTHDSYNLLYNHNWPGNIRELENSIERLVITSTSLEKIDFDLTKKITESNSEYDFNVNTIKPLKLAVEETEKKLLILALKEHQTTRKMAAALKISQSSVVKKMQKYNL